MLTSSQKVFLVMHQLRCFAGLSVPQTHFMHKMSQETYSRILKSVHAGTPTGMNSGSDINIQKSVRRLKAGFEMGLLLFNAEKATKTEALVFDMRTRKLRPPSRIPVDDSFQVAMKKAKVICDN